MVSIDSLLQRAVPRLWIERIQNPLSESSYQRLGVVCEDRQGTCSWLLTLENVKRRCVTNRIENKVDDCNWDYQSRSIMKRLAVLVQDTTTQDALQTTSRLSSHLFACMMIRGRG